MAAIIGYVSVTLVENRCTDSYVPVTLAEKKRAYCYGIEENGEESAFY